MVCFFIFYIVCLFFEYIFWRCLYTPFILMTFPIVILLIFNEFFGVQLGFSSLWEDALIQEYLFWGISAVVFSSLFSRFLMFSIMNTNRAQKESTENRMSDKIYLDIIFYSLSICLLLYVLFLIFTGIPFSSMKEYLGKGVAGHIVLINVLGSSYIYGTARKMSNIDKIMFIISLFPVFLYGTRGLLLLAILGGILCRGMLFRIWPKKTLILLSPILGIGFMTVSYLYRNFTGGVDASVTAIIQHVLGYLVAGIHGMSQLLQSGVDSQPYADMVFSGIKNIMVYFLGGEFVSNVAPNYFVINNEFMNVSNVSTAFGTILFGLGLLNGCIYIFLLFVLLYIIFYFRKRHRGYLYNVYLSMLLAGVFLSFFEYYLGLLFYLETLVFLCVIKFVLILIRNKKLGNI